MRAMPDGPFCCANLIFQSSNHSQIVAYSGLSQPVSGTRGRFRVFSSCRQRQLVIVKRWNMKRRRGEGMANHADRAMWTTGGFCVAM